MNDSSGVGDVSASTSVSSGDSGDGGISKTDGGEGGRGADLGVSSGHGSSDNRGGHRGDSGSSDGGSSVVRVSQSVVVGVGSVGVGVPGQAVVGGVSGVGGQTVSVVRVEESGVSLSIGLGLSLPLGDVDDSSRVGDVAASTSVTSGNGGDSGVGESETGGGQGGRGADLGVSSDSRSVGSVGVSNVPVGSVVVGTKTVPVSVVEEGRVSLSIGCPGDGGGKTEDGQELVHDCF